MINNRSLAVTKKLRTQQLSLYTLFRLDVRTSKGGWVAQAAPEPPRSIPSGGPVYYPVLPPQPDLSVEQRRVNGTGKNVTSAWTADVR